MVTQGGTLASSAQLNVGDSLEGVSDVIDDSGGNPRETLLQERAFFLQRDFTATNLCFGDDTGTPRTQVARFIPRSILDSVLDPWTPFLRGADELAQRDCEGPG